MGTGNIGRYGAWRGAPLHASILFVTAQPSDMLFLDFDFSVVRNLQRDRVFSHIGDGAPDA